MMKDFWHRFSVAGITIGGAAVSLVTSRRHAASSDYHMLQSVLIRFMLNNGNSNDAFLLCDLAEHYGECIAIKPDMDMPTFLNCYYISLDADIRQLKREGLINSDYSLNGFDDVFKSVVGIAAFKHGRKVMERVRSSRVHI